MIQLTLKMANVGEWDMNSYALICPETKQSVLIDPGDDPDKLMTMLGDSRPVAIWLTHTHHDHVGALDEMRQRLKLPVYAHPGKHVVDPQANHWLEHGDVVHVGNHRCEVYYTPGHIGDQICFALQNDTRIIVGDTIFEGGPGKTWSHVAFVQTLNTLRDVILPWPDESVCYPGHGPHFVLGDKRAKIEMFLARQHPRDFFGDAVW
ncbi:MBL fold metallo-hydrolase [Anaerolineales bacterium HSG24]|nr:MBL fold metallo-hydrolase [Anaerolineales bacterium HSG24]